MRLEMVHVPTVVLHAHHRVVHAPHEAYQRLALKAADVPRRAVQLLVNLKLAQLHACIVASAAGWIRDCAIRGTIAR